MIYCKKHTLLLCSALCLQAFSCANQDYSPHKYIPKLLQDEWLIATQDQKTGIDDNVDDSGYESMSDNESLDSNEQKLPFDFKSEIEKLRESADNKRGIAWRLQNDTLVRDASSAHGNMYAAEDYAVQVLNTLRAARKMCELYGKDGKQFEKMAKTFMQQYRKHNYVNTNEASWINKLKNVNKKVVIKLKEFVLIAKTEEDINQKLRLAENYVGLDDPHYNITTKFKIGDKRFALEDKKWLKLTPKQKSDYTNRKTADWYTRLDSFEQKLIDAYANKFLDGNHYIPTQLRNIPGCRNAYQKRVLTYDKDGKEIVLARYYHSGALASLVTDKVISEDIAKHNWEQILAHAKGLEVISLNNKLDIKAVGYVGEKHIVEQTERIVGETSFMYLPINVIGTFTVPTFKKHVNKLIEETSGFYNTKYPKLCSSLMQPCTQPETLQAQINDIQDLKDKAYFNRLSPLKQAAETSNVKNICIQNKNIMTDNYYANIATDYITCKTILEERKGKAESSILFSCKSGKDRTGFISHLVDGSVICATHSELNPEKTYKALAYASHVQVLASLNGGMPGRFGMKGVRKSKIIHNAEISDQLFPRTAHWTNIPLN